MERVKNAVRTSIQIDAWPIVTGVATLIFMAGYYGSQAMGDIRMLIELNKENKANIAAVQGQVNQINDRQISDHATLNAHSNDIAELKTRMASMERTK